MSLICTKCSTDFTPRVQKTRGILLGILGGFFFLFGVLGACLGEAAAVVPLLIGTPLCYWAFRCFRPLKQCCPACGSWSVIPIASPAGKKLLAEAKKAPAA